MALKSIVKKLIPERFRLARYELMEKARYYPELLLSLGRGLECPFCQWHFRRFRPAGFDYPVLVEKQVVGAALHANDVCPRCMSNSRERLVYLFLKSRDSLLKQAGRVLHIAPEPNLAEVLRSQSNVKYVSADLFEPGVMARLDLLNLPFRDGTFDAIICNHVLEHVPDDRIAMSELFRVLKVGGWAILQVPIAKALRQTFEDKSVVTDEDRIRVYGQKDHVRLYASDDYTTQLRLSGFTVNVYDGIGELGEESVIKHGLIREEEIYFCTKLEAQVSSFEGPQSDVEVTA